MSELFKQLLEKRGLDESFLMPKYDSLIEAESLPDMEKAVKRILEAREKQEKILVYGDYDVDGVTASAVMHDTLKLAGISEVEIMLPDRFRDGYGMSERVVKKVVEDNVKLVITVDCGSGNGEIIARLKEAGVDTVVTDHHECLEVPKEAVAVVNPKREDGVARELAGVGVAFMVARALVKVGAVQEGQEKWLLDLVAIGTICDSMILRDENRKLVYWGMRVLAKTRRKGLKELMRVAGVKKITGETIGFQLGPRLNAAGRMQNAETALKLVMAETAAEAAELAAELNDLNVKRKNQQGSAIEEIRMNLVDNNPVIVVVGDWHEGVLGIIAGKLVEIYHKPAFVLSEIDGIYKGSGRSFGDFNLAKVLESCKDQIISGGGHAEACGLKIEKEKINEFRTRVNEYYCSLNLSNQEKFLIKKADVEVEDLSLFNLELMKELKQLEPCGNGNEEPLWLLKDAMIVGVRKMGAESQHIKFTMRGARGGTLQAVAFFAPKKWLVLEEGQRVNMVVALTENIWNGTTSVEGRIEKISLE